MNHLRSCFQKGTAGILIHGHFAKPYHEPGRMNPARERVMAREANPWGTMWVGMSTCTASRELQYFCRKHQYQRDCIQVLGGREYLEYLPRKCGLCIWHICRHYVDCICRFRFIYGYSNVQQLYFAIWFSSSFLLDLHPSTPGGFCCL